MRRSTAFEIYDRSLTAWRESAHLQFAYPDFHTFHEHATSSWQVTHSDSEFDRVVNAAENVGEQTLAVARWRAFQSPQTSPDRFEVAQRSGARLALWIYGPIGVDTPRGALTADAVCAALDDHRDARAILLRIDSGGGSIRDANAIVEALARHRARKVAIIDRTCWSAAYDIAVSADRLFIRRGATIMVHPMTLSTRGNSVDLRIAANQLDTLDANYLRWVKRRRRAIENDYLRSIWTLGTFVDSETSVRRGLADVVIDDLPNSSQRNLTAPVLEVVR